jgi:hypothetical protein
MRLRHQAPGCPLCPFNGGGCLLQGYDPQRGFRTVRTLWASSDDYEGCPGLWANTPYAARVG